MLDGVYIFNEIKNNKIRLWINSYSPIEFDVIDTFDHTIKPDDPIIFNSKISIVVELLKHRNASNYALLGAMFIPNHDGILRVKGFISDDNGEALLDNIALPSEKVQIGLPKEYSRAILNTTIRLDDNIDSLPTGKLLFNFGAHAAAGSSMEVFSNITSLIYRLLIEDVTNMNHEELQFVIQDHLIIWKYNANE